MNPSAADGPLGSPHAVDVHEVLAELSVDEDTGLDHDEVAHRRRVFGPNRLRVVAGTSVAQIVFDQLRSAVVLVLVIPAAAGFVIGKTVEGVGATRWPDGAVEQPGDRRAPVVRAGARAGGQRHDGAIPATRRGTRDRTVDTATHRPQASLIAFVGLTAYYVLGPELGLEGAQRQTLTFVAITAAQLLAVFNARTETGSGFVRATENPFLWFALAVSVGFEAAALGSVPLRDTLGLTALRMDAWGAVLALSIVPLALTQIVRISRSAIGRRRPSAVAA